MQRLEWLTIWVGFSLSVFWLLFIAQFAPFAWMIALPSAIIALSVGAPLRRYATVRYLVLAAYVALAVLFSAGAVDLFLKPWRMETISVFLACFGPVYCLLSMSFFGCFCIGAKPQTHVEASA
jgi:hypothetical protein